MDNLRFDRLGDRALLVTLSQEISEEVNDMVLSACETLETSGIPGLEEAQPAYSSFCVHFDPSKVGIPWLKSFIRELMKEITSHGCARARRTTGREVEIPVKYGGEEGPDLAWASEHLGLPAEEIVRRHASGRYRVYMVGFAPGFPYLGGLDQSLALPRLPTPRTTVPAGSVGIGGGQTGVYPWESPGGWRIIGRTPARLFDPARKEPSLLRPGDVVRFVPVDSATGGASGEKGLNAGEETVGCDRESGDALPSVPALTVERPGLLSLVVDEGRKGHRKFGVPVSGAADANSYALANILCGNSPSAPALEMTLWGARLRALMDIVVVVTGAPCPLTLDGTPVPMNEPFLMPEDTVLEVGSPLTGCRMYLAASGGFSVPRVMGSASTYLRGSFGGLQGRGLLAGDILKTLPGVELREVPKSLPAALSEWPSRLERFLNEETPSLRVIPGPEAASALGKTVLDALCSEAYAVRNDSDRMGVRFNCSPLEVGRENGDILSSPVVPGVIQVPSDSMPVLLLCDAQTCGGYRRIATVRSEDLPLAGQLRPGARVRFVTSPV